MTPCVLCRQRRGSRGRSGLCRTCWTMLMELWLKRHKLKNALLRVETMR